MEVGDGDSQFPIYCLHQLTRRPPWFMGGLWHSYCLPQGQTVSSVNVYEGGIPIRDLYGPDQAV